MQVIKAPSPWPTDDRPIIFLSGSIEMGTAVNWQDKVADALSRVDVILLNPRRDDWDSSWVQSIDNHQFKEQVEWELKGLEAAHLILVYFDPATKSPITLLELGLLAGWRKSVIVCCPEGFWRKGNVDIICRRYGLKCAATIEEMINLVRDWREEMT